MRVFGAGLCLGETALSAEALSAIMPPAKIIEKTGIRSRRRSARPTATLATLALLEALTDARLERGELRAVLLATNSGDQWVPPTAATVARNLELACPVMDLNAACAGGLYALRLAAAFEGPVAVIAAETVSRFCSMAPGDWPSVIFGDGAAAVIVEAPPAFEGQAWGIEPQGWDLMHVLPPQHVGRMDGPALWDAGLRLMEGGLRAACHQAGLALEGLGWIVPHQPNARMLEALAARVGPVLVTVHETGNLSSASLLVTLVKYLRRRMLSGPGGLVAFGAGLVWGALVTRLTYDGTGEAWAEP